MNEDRLKWLQGLKIGDTVIMACVKPEKPGILSQITQITDKWLIVSGKAFHKETGVMSRNTCRDYELFEPTPVGIESIKTYDMVRQLKVVNYRKYNYHEIKRIYDLIQEIDGISNYEN